MEMDVCLVCDVLRPFFPLVGTDEITQQTRLKNAGQTRKSQNPVRRTDAAAFQSGQHNR